jgi:hypothetical protein
MIHRTMRRLLSVLTLALMTGWGAGTTNNAAAFSFANRAP